MAKVRAATAPQPRMEAGNDGGGKSGDSSSSASESGSQSELSSHKQASAAENAAAPVLVPADCPADSACLSEQDEPGAHEMRMRLGPVNMVEARRFAFETVMHVS